MRRRGLLISLGIAAALVILALCLASPAIRGALDDLLFRRHFVAVGEVTAGERFQADFGPAFTFSLIPTEGGWSIAVCEKGNPADLSRFTPPFHFVPNPRQLDGWHFRNLDNTRANDGSVNAPGSLREFCFWPGANGLGNPTAEEVRSAYDFGRGRLEMLDYELSNLVPGEQAAFARMSFRVELSWPRGYAP